VNMNSVGNITCGTLSEADVHTHTFKFAWLISEVTASWHLSCLSMGYSTEKWHLLGLFVFSLSGPLFYTYDATKSYFNLFYIGRLYI
jgi:hypothetical protein